MSNIKVDSIKGHDPTFTIDMDPTANLNVNGSMSVSGFGSQLAIPKGTTAQRPSSPTAGMIRMNTTVNSFEVYNGTTWAEYGVATGITEDLSLPFNLYNDSDLNAFATYMQGQKNGWAASGTNYQYETDTSTDHISDAQSDMYDGGNYTQVRKDGSSSGNMGYNDSLNTYSSIKYIPLGYSWPLVGIAVAPTDSEYTYGWSRSGNLGADGGGGSPNSVTVYANDTVQGFDKVYAWLVNKAYNQNSDPGVMHLYCTVGSSRWGSTISDGFTTTDYSSSSDNDYSQYQATASKSFIWTALVSKGQTNGDISQAQARVFVDNFLQDAASHLGFT
tara:strand:+ start:834 stop:1826 length:993 start_codon:yes stop_codon:yes gene_type:complete